jgi:hypothetical protein
MRVSNNHPRVSFKPVRIRVDSELPRIIVSLPRVDAPDVNLLAPTRKVAIVS